MIWVINPPAFFIYINTEEYPLIEEGFMVPSTVEKTIDQLILENPGFGPLFDRLQLNFEIERDLTLGEVCFIHGWNHRDFLHQLEICSRETKMKNEAELAAYDIPQLIGYILFNHHDYAEKEFPRLERLLAEAVQEGEGHPGLLALREDFRRFQELFQLHMREEERYFFPFFLMLATDRNSPSLSSESLERLIQIMESEDAQTARGLDRLRERTRGYHVPAGAGTCYHQLMEGLKFLDAELERHSHVESRILFPKVAALEKERLDREGEKSTG
jgi:regulator of cell morphogenesis and NO signaling